MRAERRAFAVDEDGAAVRLDEIEQCRPSLEQRAGEVGAARHGADETALDLARAHAQLRRLRLQTALELEGDHLRE